MQILNIPTDNCDFARALLLSHCCRVFSLVVDSGGGDAEGVAPAVVACLNLEYILNISQLLTLIA